jgi:DNA-binding LacI/PurR family transcriptional regulator
VGSEAATPRRPTIREVARLAGVSHQTVSRYLRFDPRINEANRERIGAAIAELDYRPNLVARAMRDRKTGRLALLLPHGTAGGSLAMITGASEAADEAGYVVEVVMLGGAPQTWSGRALELTASGLFEGIVSLTPLPLSAQRAGIGGTPVVVSHDYDDQMRSIGELADASCISELIERLAGDGHRCFLHLAGDRAYTSARRRMQVYLDTIERLGLESYGVADCDWLAERARRAVLELPADSGVTAIIGANDVLAAGSVRGAWERGWQLPRDLSVTGWDNNLVGAVMMPALTTVRTDYERLGRRAVTRLLAVLSGRPDPEDPEPISEIIWRESTGPAPA